MNEDHAGTPNARAAERASARRENPEKTSGRSPGRQLNFSWLVAVIVMLGLGWVLGRDAFPYLPRPIELRVIFPEGIANRIEPILSTGRYERADFLSVKYLDTTNAVFVYDAWGPGGPTSRPFAFRPGQPHTLRIDMPALDYGGVVQKREQRPLRVTFDGVELVNAPVFFYARRPPEAFFGINPITGSSTAGAVFRGELTTLDGQRLFGGPGAYFSLGERTLAFVRQHPWRLGLVLLGGFLGGVLAPPARRWLGGRLAAAQARPLRGHVHPTHRAFAITAAVCAVVFATLVTQGGFRLFQEESFGTFYDAQATSLLHGRLDVPEDAIGGEAFIVKGKAYGYFGITPAVLRLPWAAAGIGGGRLSRGYLLAYYVACLVAGYLLLLHATRRIAGPAAWPSRLAVVLLTIATGLGSTLLFLGARAYVYHEAILCGAMFALWTVYFTFRYVEASGWRWAGAALGTGWLAVHARPSSGLFALGVIGVAGLWQFAQQLRSGGIAATRQPLAIALLAALAILSFNGMSYLKFGTFDGSPFRYSVQYTPERIARFEDRNFHLTNLGHNLDTYLLAPDLEFHARFPFIFVQTENSRLYPLSRIDLEEPAVAMPFAMPALFALAVVGIGAAAQARPLRLPLALVLAGLAPMALALLTAIVTSHRFTGDFCPFLITAAAIGLAVLDSEQATVRRVALGLTLLLTFAAVVVTLALALRFQGELVWGVPEDAKQRYETLRQTVDGWVGAKR